MNIKNRVATHVTLEPWGGGIRASDGVHRPRPGPLIEDDPLNVWKNFTDPNDRQREMQRNHDLQV